MKSGIPIVALIIFVLLLVLGIFANIERKEEGAYWMPMWYRRTAFVAFLIFFLLVLISG